MASHTPVGIQRDDAVCVAAQARCRLYANQGSLSITEVGSRTSKAPPPPGLMRLALREVMLCVCRNLPLSSRRASASALCSLRQGKRGTTREGDTPVSKFHGHRFTEAFLKTLSTLGRGPMCPHDAPSGLCKTLPVLGVEGAEHLLDQVRLVAIAQLPAPMQGVKRCEEERGITHSSLSPAAPSTDVPGASSTAEPGSCSMHAPTNSG